MSEFTGKVVHVGQTESVGDKGFRKRLLVVTDGDAKYPQSVPFGFVQDNTDKLNAIKVGQSVTVHYNLRGREYNGKRYADVQGWKVDVLEASVQPENAPKQETAISKQVAAFEEESDSLPF